MADLHSDSAGTEARAIPTRRMDFTPWLDQVPKHYAKDGDVMLSTYFAILSATFPSGEDFFVRSVRHFRSEITDPELKAQVAGFIGQEAMHGRQHRALNDRFSELGYPVEFFERMNLRMDTVRNRFSNPYRNLAETAAAEHMTATMAEILLRDPSLAGHDVIAGVVLWHALEECEHKAVAFDVYRAVGGSERERIQAMKMMRFMSYLNPLMVVATVLLTDPASRRPGVLWRSWRRFRKLPVAGKQLRARMKEYERVGFHPNDNDTNALLEEWRERLFGDSGTLNEVLVSGKAA